MAILNPIEWAIRTLNANRRIWEDEIAALTRERDALKARLEASAQAVANCKTELLATRAELAQYLPPRESILTFEHTRFVPWNALDRVRGQAQLYLSDNRYWLCTEQDFLQGVVPWSRRQLKPYEADRYDCENFAFRFKAGVDWAFDVNGIGIVWSVTGQHAFNCVVFEDGTLRFFEPQTLAFVELAQQGLYQLGGAQDLVLL